MPSAGIIELNSEWHSETNIWVCKQKASYARHVKSVLNHLDNSSSPCSNLNAISCVYDNPTSSRTVEPQMPFFVLKLSLQPCLKKPVKKWVKCQRKGSRRKTRSLEICGIIKKNWHNWMKQINLIVMSCQDFVAESSTVSGQETSRIPNNMMNYVGCLVTWLARPWISCTNG